MFHSLEENNFIKNKKTTRSLFLPEGSFQKRLKCIVVSVGLITPHNRMSERRFFKTVYAFTLPNIISLYYVYMILESYLVLVRVSFFHYHLDRSDESETENVE